jgi:uncharacterized protein (DUF983 family)
MPPDRTHASFGGGGGEPTLDELIVEVWEGLAAHAAAPCPVCGAGTLRAVYGARVRLVKGRCGACGAELS